MTLPEALGTALRKHRKEQKRTLDNVAKAGNLSLGYLSQIERGNNSPSLEVVWALCSALNLAPALVCREVDDLMGVTVDTTLIERELEV